mmetsp:Transcript_27250/g.62844  ORF Transcript_27250/g.62844 Transcript_27250/m.62844 type:complete len:204 (-) Transcript_27250:115-726(-)
MNLPVQPLITSCPTMPPKMAARGLSATRAPMASWRTALARSASNSSTRKSSARAALIFCARASTVSASAALPMVGMRPFSATNASTARKPTCSKPERPNFVAKLGEPRCISTDSSKACARGDCFDPSASFISPGSFKQLLSARNSLTTGILTSATMPPLTYLPKDEASTSSISNDFRPFMTLQILRGTPSLISVMPLTSLKIT